MTERRYDDREVELILKATAESGVERAGRVPGTGLTLAQLKDIATEVGLDPTAVERAAGALDIERPSTTESWLGGPAVKQYEQLVDGVATEQDHREVVLAIRRAMGRQGIAGTELDGLEWRARDAAGGRYVSVHRQGDRTLVRVLGNFREGVGALFGVGGTMGGVLTLAVLKKTGLLAVLGFGALPVFAAAMFVPAWLTWRWWSRREDAALRRTLAAVVEALEQRNPGA